MPIYPYVNAGVLEERARVKFELLLSELVGNRISHEQALENNLISYGHSPTKDGYVQVRSQSLRFAIDELSLVLKEIKRVYGK